jgi:small subunit ribosomal protein S4
MAGHRRQSKVSEYGTQLQEKQKVRNSYGLREKQFRRYFNQAAKNKGNTGNVLLSILERRLDNVIYRSGLTASRAQARQLINHRHFSLNGHRVNIPSIQVVNGDVIKPFAKLALEFRPEATKLVWLDVDKKTSIITVKTMPPESELPLDFDTQKVIEFYSR